MSTLTATAPSASGVPFWEDEPDAWDTVWLGGFQLPGICRVEGGVKRKADQKSRSGRHGSSLTYTGDDAGTFTVHITMWTAEQLDRMTNILKAFRSADFTSKTAAAGTTTTWNPEHEGKSKFPSEALEVRHPSLAIIGFTSAHLMGIDPPKPQGDAAKGIYGMTLHLLEFVKLPKGAVHSPTLALEDRRGAVTDLANASKNGKAGFAAGSVAGAIGRLVPPDGWSRKLSPAKTNGAP